MYKPSPALPLSSVFPVNSLCCMKQKQKKHHDRRPFAWNSYHRSQLFVHQRLLNPHQLMWWEFVTQATNSESSTSIFRSHFCIYAVVCLMVMTSVNRDSVTAVRGLSKVNGLFATDQSHKDSQEPRLWDYEHARTWDMALNYRSPFVSDWRHFKKHIPMKTIFGVWTPQSVVWPKYEVKQCNVNGLSCSDEPTDMNDLTAVPHNSTETFSSSSSLFWSVNFNLLLLLSSV